MTFMANDREAQIGLGIGDATSERMSGRAEYLSSHPHVDPQLFANHRVESPIPHWTKDARRVSTIHLT